MTDTDKWRSRKNIGDLADTAHPEKSIRGFIAKRLTNKYEKKSDGRTAKVVKENTK